VVLLVVIGTAACDRTPPEPKPDPSKPKGTAEKAEPKIVENDGAFRYRAPGRIVAVGDLHGDLDATKRALRTAGVIDEEERWSGGKTVLVQTGDVLDRGDDEREIMDMLYRLTEEAKEAGGSVHVLLGNHEIMNLQGDLRYVTRGGFTSFEPVPSDAKADLTKFPEHARARAAAFLPGGPYARRLAELDTVAMVEDTVFVHGGLLPHHLRHGIDKINEEVQAWMDGKRPSIPRIMKSESAPTWCRRFSGAKVSARNCQVLASVLARLGAARMVVGHTPQKGGITSACDEQVWRIDIGLAAHYGSAPAEVLVIDGKRASIVREKTPEEAADEE